MLTESDQISNSGDTPKLRAACENCRQSKVKCNLSGKDTCIRCLRHGLPCRYRLANRSGKPKGSKNRSTLWKLGQLQAKKKDALRTNERWTGPVEEKHIQVITPIPRYTHDDVSVIVNETSPPEIEQPHLSASPRHHENPIADTSTMLLAESGTEYPPLHGGSLAVVETTTTTSPCIDASMSPTFLQKEFITKGLTSFPLAVHIPNTLRPPCDCSETLVFHLNHLRQIVTSPAQFRFDQMLQGAQAALSGCRGFLQCARGHKNNSTSLLLCMSTLEVTLQLCDYWTSCELLPSSSGRAIHHHHHHHHHHGVVTVGYGEYEMGPEETRRVRRFLIRGRLLQCKETLGLLAEAAELNMAEGVEGSWNWLRQIIGGSEAMTDTFLQVLSGGCICN